MPTLNPGDNIQAAVTANPTGTTFTLNPGTYPLTSAITPKSGQSFIGPTTRLAILDGTGWPFTGDLNQGAFRGHNQAITNVTLRNLTIQHMPMRAVHAFSGTANWLVDGCDLLYNRNAVRVAAASTVRQCRILYNTGDDTNPNPNLQGGGYGCYQATGCLFDDNEIAFNGPEQKFFESTNNTFTNNWFHDSDHGIWFDGCDGCTASGNTIEDCRIGIEYEISRTASLHHNLIRRCSHSGIFISCAYGAVTNDNVIEDCFRAIQYFLDCARAGTVTGLGFAHDLKDNSTNTNTIRVPATANATATSLVLLTGTCNAAAIALYTSATKNLRFQGNRYRVPVAGGSYWVWPV